MGQSSFGKHIAVAAGVIVITITVFILLSLLSYKFDYPLFYSSFLKKIWKNKHKDVANNSSKWYVTPWSPCSKPCDIGSRTRTVTCKNGPCKGKEPVQEEACNLEKCSKWSVKAWSSCNVQCGKGVQVRDVRCEKEPCERDKPISIRPCSNDMCAAVVPDTNSDNIEVGDMQQTMTEETQAAKDIRGNTRPSIGIVGGVGFFAFPSDTSIEPTTWGLAVG